MDGEVGVASGVWEKGLGLEVREGLCSWDVCKVTQAWVIEGWEPGEGTG